jgi:pimeloyl-ACP methyl ester carboxylesterase
MGPFVPHPSTNRPRRPLYPDDVTALNARTPARFRRPHPAAFAVDPLVGVAELAGFAALLPLLLRLPKGDGRPVLVLPGFVATDSSTHAIRFVLSRLGYATYGWDQGRNLGPTPEAIDGMLDRFDRIHREHDQSVTLVGWSLGGLYARAIADRSPAAVRHVITLGSPFRLARTDETNLGALWDLLAPLHGRQRPHSTAFRREAYQGPPPTLSTAIFSRGDGVVPWSACVDEPGRQSENIEVFGSHTGLGHNAAALTVIADRLRLQEATWRPYVPSGSTARWARPFHL